MVVEFDSKRGATEPRRLVNVAECAASDKQGFSAFAFEALEALEIDSRSTRAAMQAIVRRHLVPFFGERQLSVVAAEATEYQRAKLEEGLTGKTINNHAVMLRAIFRLAHTRGLISALPQIKSLPVERSAIRFLSLQTADRFVAATDPEWRMMFVLALCCGLRLAELRTLRWEHLDLSSGWLTSASNTRQYIRRKIPLCPGLVRDLAALPRARGYLFDMGGGAPPTHGQCKWPLLRAAKRAELSDVSWNLLRQTFGAHLALSGAPVELVQRLLGYQNAVSVQRYAPHRLVHGDEAVQRFAVPSDEDASSSSLLRAQILFLLQESGRLLPRLRPHSSPDSATQDDDRYLVCAHERAPVQD